MLAYRYFFPLIVALLLSVSISVAQENTLRTSSCRFQVPDNIRIDCMTLSVPENRNDPDSNTITLSLAILRHPSGHPEPDPIIFLQGGPGGGTLNSLHLTFYNRFAPLFAANRDIIVFDQRGIGVSRPNLECNNHRLTEIDLLDYESDGLYLSRPEIRTMLNSTLINCGETLSNLHDLSAYNTVENAADIEAIRQALGYEQVNLWGISYGTKLALTAMRDYPDSFRHVVLDSAYPLEANLYTELPANFDRALQTLFDNCAADIACNNTYPDLEAVLFQTVDALNQNPVEFDAPNPYSNQSFEDTVLDGDALLNSLFRSLYDTSLLPRLPELIYEASEGNFEIWMILVGWLNAQRDNISVGMSYAVQCQEEIFFTASGSIESAWASYPHFESYSQSINNVEDFKPICTAFKAGESPLSENQAVTSQIPTLILSGEYDPITPPRWAVQVSENLSDSYFLEFPHHGHGVSATRGCAQSIVIDFFLQENNTPVDTSCMDDIHMIFSGTQDGDLDFPDSADNDMSSVQKSR